MQASVDSNHQRAFQRTEPFEAGTSQSSVQFKAKESQQFFGRLLSFRSFNFRRLKLFEFVKVGGKRNIFVRIKIRLSSTCGRWKKFQLVIFFNGKTFCILFLFPECWGSSKLIFCHLKFQDLECLVGGTLGKNVQRMRFSSVATF